MESTFCVSVCFFFKSSTDPRVQLFLEGIRYSISKEIFSLVGSGRLPSPPLYELCAAYWLITTTQLPTHETSQDKLSEA